jgi:predicted GIY-YIG superfamily endonuclease
MKQLSTEYSVYIVRCTDDSLYTGISKNVAARVAQHNSGRGAKYTRTRRPVELRYIEAGLTHGEALKKERAIKRLPKHKKCLLCNT